MDIQKLAESEERHRAVTKVGGDMATESRYRFSGRALVMKRTGMDRPRPLYQPARRGLLATGCIPM
jgi:hypothetical protein